MKVNTVFRGCTRPPMFMGVPYTPFFIGSGICLMLAAYFNMFFILLLPVVIFVLRQIARQDEMIFRLTGLKLIFWFKARNRGLRPDMIVFSPNNHREPNQK